MSETSKQVLGALLQHCIAEATAMHGPKLLNPSEIYADMARRILAGVLEEDSAGFSPNDQIITVRVADVEAWILEAASFEGGESERSISWTQTPTGWKPRLHWKPDLINITKPGEPPTFIAGQQH